MRMRALITLNTRIFGWFIDVQYWSLLPFIKVTIDITDSFFCFRNGNGRLSNRLWISPILAASEGTGDVRWTLRWQALPKAGSRYPWGMLHQLMYDKWIDQLLRRQRKRFGVIGNPSTSALLLDHHANRIIPEIHASRAYTHTRTHT